MVSGTEILKTPELSCLSDRDWRLQNLYLIKDKNGNVVNYTPNWAQKMLLEPHYLNIVLKARQLGVTTHHAILFLDTCLFNRNINAAIVADSRPVAREIFIDKVKFAYDNLPAFVRKMVPAFRDNQNELRFANGSVYRVSTSLRGGTLQLLHITEFAKICQENPRKANEIVSGAINTVQAGQFICIESTARGREGHFFDYCKIAKDLEDSGANLTPLDFKLWFFPWWENYPEYSMDPAGITYPYELENYFEKLKNEGIELRESQKAWYYKKSLTQGEYMKREYPSCIAFDTPVLSPKGIVPIQDVLVDGEKVTDKIHKGTREVCKVTTSLGYTLESTIDHQYLTDRGFVRLKDIEEHEYIHLSGGGFGDQTQITYKTLPFCSHTVELSQDFCRFLGYFMGDGSYCHHSLSICCDAKDLDVIADVEFLINKFVGKPNKRLVGDKKGGCEIRCSRKDLLKHLIEIDLVEEKPAKGHKRKVNIPAYIKNAPKSCVKEFLRSLFEADGFAQRNGSGVKIHSKYHHFLRDIQLLLLNFGITSKLSKHNKKNSNGYEYIGFELNLRKHEAWVFKDEIGFVSKRKNDRLLQGTRNEHYNDLKLNYKDKIINIEYLGNKEVWDLSTENKQFSAGGIIVHNCPEEAFESANEGFYFAKYMSKARQDRRICHVPYDDHARTFSAWDIGIGDHTAIWVYQVVGNEVRFIDYYENSDESLSHYVKWIRRLDLDFDMHILPHDAGSREKGSGKTYAQIAREMGLKVQVLERDRNEMFGIECARHMFPRLWFDQTKTEKGIKAVESFRKEWNEKLGCYREKSLHNWSSHGAKALIYACQAVEQITGNKGMSSEEWKKLRQEYL